MLHSKPLLLLLSALGSLHSTVRAQTAPGFEPSVDTNLGVSFPNVTVAPPGILLPRSDVLTQPTITAPPGTPRREKYIIFMIDTLVPLNNTRVPLLHWFAPNCTLDRFNRTLSVPVNDSGAPYIPPTPPPGDIPHDYTEVIFAQPQHWVIPDSYSDINPPPDVDARIGFNLTDFVAASGLAPPLAGNWFQVQQPANATD